MENDKIEQKLFDLETRIVLLEKSEERSEAQHKDTAVKMENLILSNNTLGNQFGTLLDMTTGIKSDIRLVQSDVNSLKEKPAKRWDGVIDKIIYTIIGIVISLLMAKGGIL